MSEFDIINFENRLMANVFAKRPVVITRGEGALVWDINGKEYVDCMGSYGVALLGHSHPKWWKPYATKLRRLFRATQAFTITSEQNFCKNS